MTKKRKVDSDEPNEVDSDEEEEELTKVLEPFNKEQLIELLRNAASNDPKLVEEIYRVADLDPAHRKIFVHGLGWETTSDTLQSFFSEYGDIEECKVVTDKVTGKSKGYGFLLFKHRRSAQKALKQPQKKIESRMTACQLASAGPVPNPPQNPQIHNQETLARKIYVGNVHSEIPSNKLLAFFSKFGDIEEGPLGFDKHTGKSKGFALFIYKTVQGAMKALEEPNKNFEGNQLYCQKATDSHKLRAGNGPGFNPSGSGGGGANINMPDLGMAHQSAALLGQGLLAGGMPFGQGVPPNHAALAVLAAAGQNPAAFGVSPAMLASLNPALAAAMNPAGPPVGSSAMIPQGFQGYGMGNPGYQGGQGHQANSYYQSGHMGQVPGPRPYSGSTGGYVSR